MANIRSWIAPALMGIAIAGSALSAEVSLKLGHLANEQDSWHLASMKFAELVAKKTNGAVEIKVFPNEQLGKEIDLINALQLGSADFTISGESMQNWAPKAALLAVPYLIRDEKHLDAVAGGALGQEIAKEIEEKVLVKPIAFFARGPRMLTSNRPIKTPDELKGMVMRVPNVPMFLDVWQSLGAKPTPMAFSEVFTGLQQKVIEGQENPLALIRSASFFEVQKYVNQTEHVRSWIYLIAGAKKLASLKPAYQQAILESAKEAQAYERELFHRKELEHETFLKSKGMEFVSVDKKAFSRKAEEGVNKSLKPEILELYQKIKAM